MTADTVACRHGQWTWGAAALRSRRTMRRGTLHAAAGDFDLDVTDRRRLGVVARTGGRTVVTLHPSGALVPGPGGPANWSLGRHSGTLTRDGNRIHVQAGRTGGLRVEVTGDWPDADLLVLTACFAVLTVRRRRLIMAIAIATGAAGARG